MEGETITTFEGPEKRLSLIFDKNIRTDRDPAVWSSIAESCGAVILSRISTPCLDSYLLSQSSLFVWDNRLVLLTCGRGKLIRAIDEIFTRLGKDGLTSLSYQRKSLLFPDLQESDFEKEAAYIRKRADGNSWRMGPADKNHIHLFLSHPKKRSPAAPEFSQLMMYGLNREALTLFSKKEGQPHHVLKKSGIPGLFPGMAWDSRLFDPCGFSTNGVLDDSYLTLHITPETRGSYAGLESNLDARLVTEKIHGLIGHMMPEHLMFFAKTTSSKKALSLRTDFTNNLPSSHELVETDLHTLKKNGAHLLLRIAKK